MMLLRLVSLVGILVAAPVTGQEALVILPISICNGMADGADSFRGGDGSEIQYSCLDGKRHGTFTGKAGGVRFKTPWVNGNIHGIAEMRIENQGAAQIQKIQYVNGKRHGTTEIQIKSITGSAYAKVEYVDDKRHGIAVSRLSDGTNTEAHYVNDEQHGLEITRNSDGKVIETKTWDNGKLVESITP